MFEDTRQFRSSSPAEHTRARLHEGAEAVLWLYCHIRAQPRVELNLTISNDPSAQYSVSGRSFVLSVSKLKIMPFFLMPTSFKRKEKKSKSEWKGCVLPVATTTLWQCKPPGIQMLILFQSIRVSEVPLCVI